jgi:hypothetical protein
MNSYQTTNAAFVAAGQTAKEGVAHGVSYHAAAQRKFRFRWVAFRNEAERQLRKTLTFGERYGSRGFFPSAWPGLNVAFDLETIANNELPPGTYKAKVVGATTGRSVGHWNAEDKERQLALYGKRFPGVTIIDDIEPARSPWDASVLALQERGTRLRDQSEDRPQPKFLVAGYGLHGAYQVLRRRDLKLIATYTGEGAAEQANNALDLLESAA